MFNGKFIEQLNSKYCESKSRIWRQLKGTSKGLARSHSGLFNNNKTVSKKQVELNIFF